jgi:hypothetical protein
MQDQVLAQETQEIPKHWQPHTIPADEVENGLRRVEPYTWYKRQVGPWTLEAFPPDESFGDWDHVPASYTPRNWTGYCEVSDGQVMEVEAESLAEAARLIEQMMATMLTSCLMGLVGGNLPDVAWETAVSLAED